MVRRTLSDEELAAMPANKRAETLKKRRQRAVARGEIVAPKSNLIKLPVNNMRSPAEHIADLLPERIEGVKEDDERSRAMYESLRVRMVQAGTWGGEATHGILLSYVLATVTIEQAGPHPALITSQRQCWKDLELGKLPPEKVRKTSRFGGF